MMEIRTKKLGFTLIEVLVSLMVVGLIMGQVASVTWANHRGTQQSGKRLQAYFLAQEERAGVQTRYDEYYLNGNGWADFTDFADTNFNISGKCIRWNGSDAWDSKIVSDPDSPCSQIMEGTSYTMSVEISNVTPAGAVSGNYRKVDINVSWSTNTNDNVKMEYYLVSQ